MTSQKPQEPVKSARISAIDVDFGRVASERKQYPAPKPEPPFTLPGAGAGSNAV